MVSRQQPKVSLNQNLSAQLANSRRAWVEIDLAVVAENVRTLRSWLEPQTKLMAVVKADAYGHGAATIARVALAHGADSLAIATLAEGVELRRSGITAPISILGAINAPEDIKAVAAWELEATIGDLEQAQTFERTLRQLERSARVHLKLDTGMSRLGTNWHSAVEFVNSVRNLKQLEIASIYSHFATADDRDRSVMNLQHQRFQNAIAQLRLAGFTPPQIHLANSAAALSDRSTHYDLVRVGLALYGLYPAPHLHRVLKLKPALQVKARVAQVKTIPAGEGVSYGRKFVTKKPTVIAVVGIGYADGIPRSLSNQIEVLVDGKPVPQIGNITMDQLMLELDDDNNVRAGDTVTLIGQDGCCQITADDWADRLDTISWEILCGFKHRLPRIYLGVDRV